MRSWPTRPDHPSDVADLLAEARVFVVDDHPSNVALLKAVLTRAGLRQIFTETDPRQVLPRLSEVDPDLIILDLHMPHLDGFAVLAQIRQYASSDYLPVLVLTADTTAAASERALGAGAQDFVTKPFNNSEVLLRARNLLQTRFLYTSLRSSIVRQAGEQLREERRLSEALSNERESVERLERLGGLKDTLLQTDMLAADARGTRPLTIDMRSDLIAKVGLSAKRMDRLLTDLLESDPMRRPAEHLVACDVGELVRRVLATVDLTHEHPLETAIVSIQARVEPVHVERIVENLLANARHHLNPGVPIWVKTGPLADGVLITVEDAGPGIPADVADSLFQPFRRGADAGAHGMGLGLWLVSRFAQLHGGRAWVDQRPGGGASFRVFLPSRMAPDADAGQD
jgi:signal transduction histidine kinase